MLTPESVVYTPKYLYRMLPFTYLMSPDLIVQDYTSRLMDTFMTLPSPVM